ncbi:hypothetical protein BL250_12525 [Erwinia sp. OLTSP20]|uniref:hypothetical protein n=1 Tax=Enterobacterales TaxID=91347 RepID=UPI000C186BD6|nr:MULTISPECIES: hypothetical protein [Enterobacterales]PII85125.1 hypothetical protein BMF91_23905 [Serratia sp. OLFL2]PIJ49349.1 hypothetical protein BV501_12990 [Erwinia sp. OAMSP11]PIJ69743.1 hypothetical protein BK416_13815 [Erwinia sp. OLSSP12]PIJ76227.1 hypothetical protein BLD47_18070 [Erwinia sp. OLCASP19]PIJ76748.1 hypothetical protein BLD46_18295 [Erwinia sp. OLMTSP26]
MKTFQERYSPFFESICRMLGNSWRVNYNKSWNYRIFLTSPEYKNYSVSVADDKGRLRIYGSVDSRICRIDGHSCTVSPGRDQHVIAAEIQRKILVYAPEEIEKAKLYEQGYTNSQEHKKIVKGMLSQLVSLSGYYNALTGYVTSSGIRGAVEERSGGYDLKVENLSTEELIRVVGFLSEMKRSKE